jgi:ketosteroid isomerase-like protein
MNRALVTLSTAALLLAMAGCQWSGPGRHTARRARPAPDAPDSAVAMRPPAPPRPAPPAVAPDAAAAPAGDDAPEPPQPTPAELARAPRTAPPAPAAPSAPPAPPPAGLAERAPTPPPPAAPPAPPAPPTTRAAAPAAPRPAPRPARANDDRAAIAQGSQAGVLLKAIDAYEKAVTRNSPDEFEALLADEVEFWSPAGAFSGAEGRQRLLQSIEDHVNNHDRLTLDPSYTTIAKDSGVFEFRAVGDTTVNGDRLPYRFRCAMALRVRDGLIVSVRTYQGAEDPAASGR